MTLSIYTELTEDIWQRGHLYPGGYAYHAKVFGLPSQHGIEGGRVSKLSVRDRQGRIIINYERGWDVKPRFFHLKNRAVLKAILAHYDGPEFGRQIQDRAA